MRKKPCAEADWQKPTMQWQMSYRWILAYSGCCASQENVMVVCPVALAVGCRKCPVVRICPAKSIIGDYKPDDSKASPKPKPAETAKSKKH